MPRTYVTKNKHTSPERAGKLNLENVNVPTDDNGIMKFIMPLRKHGQAETSIYHGQWTDEQFVKSVDDFFDYCFEKDFKPTIPALQVWLGVCRAQYYEWKTKPEKFGVKTDVINEAERSMEVYLQSNLDKYPTGSIFLLKTSHGLVETTNVNVTNNNPTSKEEIADVVSKLGLDKE